MKGASQPMSLEGSSMQCSHLLTLSTQWAEQTLGSINLVYPCLKFSRVIMAPRVKPRPQPPAPPASSLAPSP